MQIALTLRGMLAEYLPPGTGRYSRPVEVADDATIATVLTHFHVPKELVHLVLLNGVHFRQEQFDATLLHAQDTLAIWPPLSGG